MQGRARAITIGVRPFNQYEWPQGSGTSMIDDWWLNKLFKLHPDRMMDLRKIRNSIAFDDLGLFRSKKPGDHIHVQACSDDNVSMKKSLAACSIKGGPWAGDITSATRLTWASIARGAKLALRLRYGKARDQWTNGKALDRNWEGSACCQHQ